MVLEYCRQCSHEISPSDEVCPECGKSTGFRRGKWLAARQWPFAELAALGITLSGSVGVITAFAMGVDTSLPWWVVGVGVAMLFLSGRQEKPTITD